MYARESPRLQPVCTIKALVQRFSFGAAFVISTWLNSHVTSGEKWMPTEAEGLAMSSKPEWTGLLSAILSQSLKATPEGTACQAPLYFSTTVEKEEVSSPGSTKSKTWLEPRR